MASKFETAFHRFMFFFLGGGNFDLREQKSQRYKEEKRQEKKKSRENSCVTACWCCCIVAQILRSTPDLTSCVLCHPSSTSPCSCSVCVSSMNGNIRHTDTDTPELGQPQILNQGPFCGLSLGPDSSARLNGLKMPILTMVMGQGPQLLLPYEDEHMKLVFLSSLLVAYPIIRKPTCKPCLSGVGCACMYKRGHRRCSDKYVRSNQGDSHDTKFQ